MLLAVFVKPTLNAYTAVLHVIPLDYKMLAYYKRKSQKSHHPFFVHSLVKKRLYKKRVFIVAELCNLCVKRANETTEEEIFEWWCYIHSGDGGYWVPITPHISEFRANYHNSLMESTSLSHSLRPEVVIVITFFFLLSLRSCLTLFDKLHKHWVVATDSEPKAIFIFLDDNTSLDQTCKWDRQEDRKTQCLQKQKKVNKINVVNSQRLMHQNRNFW